MIEITYISLTRHKIRFIPVLLIIILFTTKSSAIVPGNQQYEDNPFLAMARENYAEYSEELRKKVYLDIDLRDSVWATQTAVQMREAARISGNKKWILEATLFEADYRFYRSIYLRKSNQQEVDLLVEEMNTTLLSIIKQAEKIDAKDIQLRALYSIMENYAYTIKNYEMGFRYCYEMDKVLSTVSAETFPFKPVYYFEIATLYLQFREYETTVSFLKKVLDNPEEAYRQRILERTWNELGLIYRNHYKDLTASDSCFSHILELKPTDPELISPTANQEIRLSLQDEYELWAAIAKGNLGDNAYLRGEYEKAIPLLEYGMEKSVESNPYNYPYAAGKALSLARIFLAKNDLPQAKHYINKTYNLLDLSRKKEKVEGIVRDIGLWTEYYKTHSRYWRMREDYAKALLYADSTLTTRALFEDDFSLRKLHRAEQRIKQEELETEKLRSQLYRRSTLIITVFLLVICLLLVILYYYYRKKKAAYHELVQKNKQWARRSTFETIVTDKKTLNENIETTQPATLKEREIIGEAHNLLLAGLFSDPDLSLDLLAEKMGINRNVLSRAINAVTEKNFNQFINEYRIKETIRILSTTHQKKLSIDELYEQVGFNSRSAFYRIFKQVTGLSPNEFRKSLS